MLRLYGFDNYKGFYHKLFFARKSLACDIVEPFRAIAEKTLLKTYNLNQIKEKDFKFKNGCFSLDYQKSEKYAKLFLDEILNYKEEIFLYTKNFYRFIMGENSKFPFFKIK